MKVAEIMLALTIFHWFVLTFLYTWRLIKFPKTVIEKFTNLKTTFIFFAFIPATNVCGILVFKNGFKQLAITCWVVSFLYWPTLMYFGFASL